MKMYIVTISAHWFLFGSEHIEWAPVILSAESLEEAWGKAMKHAKKRWSPEDGYFSHASTEPQDASDVCLWYAREMGYLDKAGE